MRVPAALRKGPSVRRHPTTVPLLLSQIQAVRLPEPVTEHRFHAVRLWRFDVAWPDRKLAVEVDGGGFINGGHSRGKGMERDCEKYAEAVLSGWRILRTTPAQVKSGQTLTWIERALLSR